MFLVINAGSSSLKFQLFQVHGKDDFTNLASGLFERIGLKQGNFVFKSKNHNNKESFHIKDHLQAVLYLCNYFKKINMIKSYQDIIGVGHRYVNAGESLIQSCLVTDEVIDTLSQNIELAPLHNPGAIATLRALREKIAHAPHVLVFDTGYHHTIPEVNYLYPVPLNWYKKYAIRRYGAHGISYRYIVKTLSKIIDQPLAKINAIICHLGNGASICAVKNGQSVNTSMGFTPLEGLMMGSRSGDLDPTIITYLNKKNNMTPHEFSEVLNKKSGLMGVSELSSDIRDLEEAANQQNNQKATLALNMFVNRICRYISYYQNEFDRNTKLTIVFTAGIGENAVSITNRISQKLATLNLKIDPQINAQSYEQYVHLNPGNNESCDVYKIRTNEEFVICQDVYNLTH